MENILFILIWIKINAFNQKNFIVSQLNSLVLYFSPFQSYLTLTRVLCLCALIRNVIHMNAKLHKTFPLYWWAAPLRLEWVSLAWGFVIKIQYGKSLFSFICLALKCLHWGPKSFSAKNVSFWGHVFQICLCLLFMVILSFQNPYFSYGGSVPSRLE